MEAVKRGEGRAELVTALRPLDTLRVAQSPAATVVKNRAALVTIFGLFNTRKAESPWLDVRLRQAAHMAINREDLIQYAAKGNGLIVPALIPGQGFGYDPDLTPYPFEPTKAQHLLREAGYASGRPITLIAPEELQVQATVVGKMLEHAGFTVDLQILDASTYNRKVVLSHLEQSSEHQAWDIALVSSIPDVMNFPVYMLYRYYALDGPYDWIMEQPELRHLYEQVLGTVDREQQQALIRRMERHTRDQAYFLFLYNPIQLYAVTKGVHFVPYANGILNLAETSLMEQH